MTEAATIARDNAAHCEAIKYAYRQTKEGVVVSFVIHPSDIPPALQVSPIGARYVLALVELDDQEQPKKVANDRKVTTKPAPEDAPVRARRPVAAEKRLAQQAGIAASDPIFQRYLCEFEYSDAMGEESAAMAIRRECKVTSRSEIIPGSQAADTWDKLYSRFTAWKLAA